MGVITMIKNTIICRSASISATRKNGILYRTCYKDGKLKSAHDCNKCQCRKVGIL